MSSSSTAGDVFKPGKFPTAPPQIVDSSDDKNGTNPPPKPLLIVYPSEEGDFPVVILLHGYLLLNSFYTQLLQHVASHGFILVAPQLYKCSGRDCSDDIIATGEIADWLAGGLSNILPQGVSPDLEKLALSGHSRGGKTAFGVALNKCSVTTTIPFKALIGIDPVEGVGKACISPPPILTSEPRSFDLGMPVMVIGSGLGEARKCLVLPPCAAKGMNHKEFFNESKPPACYFVAKDYGHMDMLDDETNGVRGIVSKCTCKNGKTREPMRRFVGGIMVAFLEGNRTDLIAVKYTPEIAPVELSAIELLF